MSGSVIGRMGREITIARRRMEDRIAKFKELNAEAWQWADMNLWTMAEEWFSKAARMAKEAAHAQRELEKLEQARTDEEREQQREAGE